jgi:hypothetical protein
MKVEILTKSFIGTGANLMPGQVHDLDDAIAQRLIDRGLAKEIKKAKPKPKKTNRAVKKLTTPEDE